jgi:periplasmic divalent cation tolerance protein
MSVFWRAGEFGGAEEWLVLLNTTSVAYPELETYLVDNHEWTSPEISAVPLVAGLALYLGWVERTTSE